MRILVIDLSHAFRRAWEQHSEKDLGEPGRSVAALVARLREGFDRVAIACDAGASWRKSVAVTYKANREYAGAPYHDAIRRIEERLAADGCHLFKGPPLIQMGAESHLYAEADDVIGALVRWAIAGEHTVRIVSGDKDLLGLIDDERGVDVLRFDLLDSPVIREQDVMDKLGITPRQIPDWLAFAGDASDGYKAFPGWEETDDHGVVTKKAGIAGKTAAKLLAEWRTVAGVFDALASTPEHALIKGHVGAVLRKHGLQAGLKGLALASLKTELPLDFSVLEQERPVAPIGGNDYFEEPTVEAPPPTPAKVTPAPPTPIVSRAASDKPSVALTIAPQTSTGIDRYAFQPRDIDQLWRTSKALFNSRLYTQYGCPESIMAIGIEAAERGIPIGIALRNGYVVKGRPAWSASFIAGLVMASGKAEIFEIVETTSTKAVLEYKRVGRPLRTFEFTIEEARDAGWMKSGEKGDGKWLTNPRTMLRWAAIRECARFAFYDVVSGMYTPDELRNGEVLDAEFEEAS